MALVHQQGSSSSHVHENPMDEELAIAAGKQFVAVDNCDNPDADVGYGPLRTVRPESVQNGQEKLPGFRIKHGARKTRTKKTSSGLVKTYKRKRGRPAGSNSAKSKIEQKPALFDGTSGSSSNSKGDRAVDFEPPTPTRKRGRPARSKSSKRKMEQEQFLVDSSSGSSSEGKKDKNDDFQPELSDDGDDDSRKKCARVKGTALDRATELHEKLPAEVPSFVKCMKQSHVVRGFWLGLPAEFCRNHLPKHDVEIALEDEEGHIKYSSYLAYKNGLSGGWQGFVKLHHLKVDDVVVFQLVSPTKFKVFILRESKLTATDGAPGLLSMGTSMELKVFHACSFCNVTKSSESRTVFCNAEKEEERSNEDTKSKEEELEVVTRVGSKASGDDSNNLASEEAAVDGIRSPGPNTGDFAAVKRLINFKIVVGNGSVVGHRALPDHLRKTYYELCQARKAFLHRNLLKTISPALATQLIMETANIAEGIRASSPASLEDLAGWKKTLELFEPMGMDVAFMRKRIDDLLDLLNAPSSTLVEPEGYEAVKLRRASAMKQLRYLESSMSILKDSLKEMDVEMEQMVEASAKKQKDQAVQNLATAPW